MGTQDTKQGATITFTPGGITVSGKRVVVLSWNDDNAVSALVVNQSAEGTTRRYQDGTMGILPAGTAYEIARVVCRAIHDTRQPPPPVSTAREQIRQGGLVFDFTKDTETE